MLLVSETLWSFFVSNLAIFVSDYKCIHKWAGWVNILNTAMWRRVTVTPSGDRYSEGQILPSRSCFYLTEIKWTNRITFIFWQWHRCTGNCGNAAGWSRSSINFSTQIFAPCSWGCCFFVFWSLIRIWKPEDVNRITTFCKQLQTEMSFCHSQCFKIIFCHS